MSPSPHRHPDAHPQKSPAAAHLQSSTALAQHLAVDPVTGLDTAEAARRIDTHGSNALAQAAPPSLARRFARQFSDVMILVLLAAALIAALMGEALDASVILVIVVLNAVMGVAQEWRADRALLALRSLAAPQATVRRDGQHQQINTEHLVPGDVVLLEAGNLVPADLRLHEARQLRIDESALTGESVSADKHDATLPALPQGEHPLGDRCNMAYKGTLVTNGRAVGLVVATGMGTELGQIARLMTAAPERATPLQQRLAALGRRLSLLVLLICGALFGLGLLRGEPPLLMALTALSLAVAAIPEALPAVVTVLLALGARRMAQAQALVRRLPAVETLGSVNVICSDKTGTLTLNRMSVACALAAPDEAAPATAELGAEVASRTASVALWRAALLCNDAQAYPATHDADATPWLGDPTETALLEGAQAYGLHVARWRSRLPREHEWPFDSVRKRMSTLHKTCNSHNSGWLLVCKGAPEAVLPRCSLFQQELDDETGSQTTAWQARADALAAQGLRVLALAQRRWLAHDASGALHASPATLDAEVVECDLELLGLIGLIDPPRPEAADAVAQCRAAGITPVMITGDHPATALAIARRLGLITADDDALLLTGPELAALNDGQFAAEVDRVRVYARVDPAQKIRIVQALQARGQYVAMTGDGVNDAPALKAADIGVAMGRGGTDVAREAAALVLLDDHFASIVGAVREGRRIYDNIRKFVRYVMTGNSGEIWTLALAPLLGLPLPLVPIQILWVNLVTDGLPGMALAAEPAERGVMQRPPRPLGESLFAGGLWQHTLWVGLLIGALCLGVQAWGVMHGEDHGQTMVFTVLTLAQLAHVLAIRSETEPIWRLNPFSNLPLTGAVLASLLLQAAVIYAPPLQAVFHTQALSAGQLGLCLACAAVVMLAVELEKAWRRRKA